jgi:hypothetical protein
MRIKKKRAKLQTTTKLRSLRQNPMVDTCEDGFIEAENVMIS